LETVNGCTQRSPLNELLKKFGAEKESGCPGRGGPQAQRLLPHDKILNLQEWISGAFTFQLLVLSPFNYFTNYN